MKILALSIMMTIFSVSVAVAAGSPADAVILPAFVKGKKIGLTIKNIREASLYDRIGLKEGDVITSFNGENAAETDNAAAKFANSLKDGSCRIMVIIRNGQKIPMNCYSRHSS